MTQEACVEVSNIPGRTASRMSTIRWKRNIYNISDISELVLRQCCQFCSLRKGSAINSLQFSIDFGNSWGQLVCYHEIWVSLPLRDLQRCHFTAEYHSNIDDVSTPIGKRSWQLTKNFTYFFFSVFTAAIKESQKLQMSCRRRFTHQRCAARC